MPNNAPHDLDAVDWAILRILAFDGRVPNNALAEAVGVAPSTSLARVRSLRERGVIRGFHADIDLAALGLPMQALIAVRLCPHNREEVDAFRTTALRLPGVLAVFHVAGADDYLLHVATAGSDALRNFVLDHLIGHPTVQHAQTSLIFEYVRGTTPFQPPAGV